MVQKININTTCVKSANARVPSIKGSVNGTKNTVNNVRYSIQSCVSGRANISNSLSNIYSELNQVEVYLQDLYNTVNSCVDIYISADDNVKRMAHNIRSWK